MLPPTDERNFIDAKCWREILGKPYRNGESSRTTKWTSETVPDVGVWRMDNLRGLYGREISVMIEINPNILVDSEFDEKGRLFPDRREDALRYEQWIREWNLPPPIEVLETEQGRLKVTNGHRRLVATRNAGVPIRCWVSPAVNVPTRALDCNNNPIKTGLTFEMWRDAGESSLQGSTFCQALLLQEPWSPSP